MRLQLIAAAAIVAAHLGVAVAQPSLTPPTTDGTNAGDGADDVDDGDDASDEDAEPTTGAVRTGVYEDSDHTRVLRVLGVVAVPRGVWTMNASLGVDAVTSASVDVRSSPLGDIDVVTSASGRTSSSGGEMTDTRAQLTAGATWNDGSGHAATLTAVGARERDYESVGGDLNGSYDILTRSTTLLGGLSYTSNRIGSVLDPTLDERMTALGWSAGVARALTPDDLLRVRYDGGWLDGYQASPYRNVRFGDWMATVDANQRIMFSNTIGSTDGLPESEPTRRVRHAVALDWLHALGDAAAVHPSLRVSHDSWQLDSLTAALELRVAKPTWRLELGYRLYLQSKAYFFEDKYTSDPSMYAFYTSDKDLGDQVGHVGSLSISKVLEEPEEIGGRRLLLDLRVDAMRYRYPSFVLLGERTSAFAQLGLTWEL